MSTYTLKVRNIIDIYSYEEVENWFKDYKLEDYLTKEQIKTINDIGIWTKEKLAKKIIDHYYMREIGSETPALFKHYAKVAMQEIMESKLPLIYSNSIQYDPLVNVDYTETFERNIKGEADSKGTSNSNSKNSASGLNINNDTPQSRITKQDLSSGAYASSVNQSETESKIEDTTNTNSNSNSNTDENYTKRVKGNSGVSATAQKMIEQYRQNIISIDRDIIEELNSLFMGLY